MYYGKHHATMQGTPFSTHSGVSTEFAPVFTKYLQDVTSPRSQLVVLECRVQGSSPLNIQWYKEEMLIKDSADFRILRKKACLTAVPEEVCTLVITEAFPEDSGLYNCVATNRSGATSCCAQLTVFSENQKTQADVFQSSTGLYPDSSLQQSTFVNDNGIPATINHSKQCVLENTRQNTCKHVTFGSEAQILEVYPDADTSSSKNHNRELYRYPNHSGKKIVKSPKPTSDEQIQGSKNAVIQDLERKLRHKSDLLHDGQQRLTYEQKMARRLLGAENAASVLDLQKMENEQINQQHNSSDSQRWQACQSPAERHKIREFENENASIQEKLYPPRFLQKPDENLFIQQYGLCRIDCKVSGLPPPELTWHLNGQPVQQDIGHKMLVSGKGVHSLIIDAVTERDAGMYECVAANRAGQCRFTVHLEVEARGVILAPEFIYKLQNSKAVEGGQVKLECQVTGEPQPIIFWRKDHEMIKHNTDRISLYRSSNGKVGLEIFPVDKSDAGWYTVSAQNEAGSTICTARLDIAAWPVKQVPNTKPLKVRPTFTRYSVLNGHEFLMDSGSQYTTSPYPGLVESDEL
ncbi:myotilin isoform X1 [Scyliorhinus canicula]|uniref:myotilin isoform X1 n=1 Tax=Scyliorhinus canicula TaxID=7830 RepID=UPI0018F735B3|nr:myotilin isoform X1 [Scyliorhinus canicula]XP_038651702.1 myotilin isoform X1 [Scyliorhinus canicula]XP_038651703.1 myotilin isoform X1 [Scyliorhinus canicula]XP_038651704.1 myotilin isoform X1 [Scyliorhinus canicula]